MILLNQTIRGGLEIHDEPVEIRNCTFIGGPTCLRCIDCTDVQVIGCKFSGATGPPDPHGQCVQLIRSTGLVEDCRFDASDQSEDLLSVYGDLSDPDLTPAQVERWQRHLKEHNGAMVRNCKFNGRGKSKSSTSICLDGPDCCGVSLDNVGIYDARVGVQVASLRTQYVVHGVTYRKCRHELLVWDYYKETKNV